MNEMEGGLEAFNDRISRSQCWNAASFAVDIALQVIQSVEDLESAKSKLEALKASFGKRSTSEMFSIMEDLGIGEEDTCSA